MRRMLLMTAGVVVVVANGWCLFQAGRDRDEARGGRIELTERELRMEAIAMESTVTVLRLRWNVQKAGDKGFGPAVWLDAAKLEELGFDCTMLVSNPNARRHYGSMPPRPVFLAMEYQGETRRSAVAKTNAESRLWVVDAAQDPDRLRARYLDQQHYFICRGLVRLSFRDSKAEDGSASLRPRLEGWIQSVYPEELFVPLPYSRSFSELRRTSSENPETTYLGEPRFAVRVAWGANYEPWVEGVRVLSTEKASKK